jgi:FGGY-family pentulose kinase
MGQDFIIGIDGGTECVKAGIFDLKGNIIGISSYNYDTYHQYPGWAEQKVEEWQYCLYKAVRETIKISGVKPEAIVGISYDATCCSPIWMDEDGKPLRNAIIWMDVRAAEEASLITSIKHPARRYNGYGNVSPEWFPCKNLWVKKHQPDIYRKTKIAGEYTDFLTHELTGNWTLGISTITLRGYYDNRNGGWQKDFYAIFGLDDIFEKLPKRILRLGEIAGGVCRKFAKETGLPEGVPVGQGAVDATSASIGSNAFTSGRIFMAAGSSTWIQINIDREFSTKGLFGSYPDLVVDNFSIEGGQISTGSVLKWFKTQFINKNIEDAANAKGTSVYNYMDMEASKLPLGSEGIIILDHWQGNRTPFTDPNSRGVIRGLTLKHTPFHIYRAIMESVAYDVESSLSIIKENNFTINEIIGVGGHMNSELWTHIYADVSGFPIKKTTTPEATCLGSAIIAAVAAGKYNNIVEAADNMVHFGDEIKPDMNNHEKYKFFIQQYKNTYMAVKEDIYKTNDYIRKL